MPDAWDALEDAIKEWLRVYAPVIDHDEIVRNGLAATMTIACRNEYHKVQRAAERLSMEDDDA